MATHQHNALGISGGIVGFIGWLGSPILKIFGAVDLAMNLHNMMQIFPKLNWTPLYMFLCIGCVAFLVLVNWGRFSWWRKAKKRGKIRSRTKPLHEALKYIVDRSAIGESFISKDRVAEARKVFIAAAAKGKIIAEGRKNKGDSLEKIPKWVWALPGLELTTESRSSHYSDSQPIDILFIRAAKKEGEEKGEFTPVYLGALVDEDDVEKLWPKSSRIKGGGF